MDRLGRMLGLSDCRVFLTNKYVNDVFYTGVLKGRPCIVKCSSKCPESIANEYAIGRRIFAVAPGVVAEPLALHADPAFVVTERVAGPSLTEIITMGVTPVQADVFARDIFELAGALRATGILHRDLFTDNFLLGADGHLRVIDWQLAIDRKNYHEDSWVIRNWKFHYVIFGVNHDLPCGSWNDVSALRAILKLFPQTACVLETDERLSQIEGEAFFHVPIPMFDRLRLLVYAVSLSLQCLVHFRGVRHDKVRRRLLTVLGWGRVDVDGRDPSAERTARYSGSGTEFC